MSLVPEAVLSEEVVAAIAAFDYQEVRKRAEQEKRDVPVPSQWPDSPTFIPGLYAENATRFSAVSSVQIEYGILFLDLCEFRSKLQGQWRPRVILEHDGSYTEYDLRWCPILRSGLGSGRPRTTLQSDVSLLEQPCKAVLHVFFERYTDSSLLRRDGAVENLGSINLGLFSEPSTREFKSYALNNGAVEVDIKVAFSRAQLPDMGYRLQGKWGRYQDWDLGGLELVEATDTDMFYLMATIPANDYRQGSANFSLDSPWILPARFIYKSPGRLHLLSPLSSSWHLLGLVQRCRRVTNEEAQLYSAQLLCALESLHKFGIIGLLTSENILLDVFGNIRITTPRLFTNDQSHYLGQLAYAAPEVLNGDTLSQATDWWILGCFIYEILTGLPPFYHQDAAERNRKIVDKELGIPSYLQSAAVDVLQRLLMSQPNQRLGGEGGASEIKKHNFFLGVKWQHLSAEYSKLSPFQPHSTNNVFTIRPSQSLSKSSTKSSGTVALGDSGELTRHLQEEGNFIIEVSGHRNTKRTIGRLRRSLDVFNSLLSGPIVAAHLSPDQAAAKALQADPECEGYEAEAVMSRLKAALQTNQSIENVAFILDNCTSQVRASVLRSPILLVNNTPIDALIRSTLKCDIPITALEWTVELGRVDLALLLLNLDADPDCTFDENYGPALTRAARERRMELVDLLAPRTSRILATRALCLAIEQRDILTAGSLLSHGVHCDFDTADHLLGPPLTSRFDWCHQEGPSWPPEPTFNLGPLVRATRHGDESMVRLLLNYGASPNATYHDMINLAPESHATWQDAIDCRFIRNHGFSCGRVVQLAMQLGHQDVVDALLEGGADVWLPHPEWPVPRHICPLVPRSIYLQVTTGLEAARCSRK